MNFGQDSHTHAAIRTGLGFASVGRFGPAPSAGRSLQARRSAIVAFGVAALLTFATACGQQDVSTADAPISVSTPASADGSDTSVAGPDAGGGSATGGGSSPEEVTGGDGATATPAPARFSGVRPIKPVEVTDPDSEGLGTFHCDAVTPSDNTVRCIAIAMMPFTIFETVVDGVTMDRRFPQLRATAAPSPTAEVMCQSPIFGDASSTAGGGQVCFEQVGPDVYVVVFDQEPNLMDFSTLSALTAGVVQAQ